MICFLIVTFFFAKTRNSVFHLLNIRLVYVYLSSSDLDSQIGGTLKWLLFVSPSPFSSFSIPRYLSTSPSSDSSLTFVSRFHSGPTYRAPFYRAVHNPEGLITYSSRERESSRYEATHKLISPAPRSPTPERGIGRRGRVKLVHPLPRAVLPLRSNSIYL